MTMRTAAVLVAVLALGAGIGCSRSGTSDRLGGPYPLALLDHLDHARLEGDALALLSGTVPASSAGSGDEFDGPLDAGWTVGRASRDGAPPWARLVTDPDTQQPALALFAQGVQLDRSFPLSPGAGHRVSVRLRAMVPDAAQAPGVHVRPLARLPDGASPAQRMLALTMRGDNLEWNVAAAAGDPGWQVLTVTVPPAADMAGVGVRLLAGSGGVLVDWLRISRLSPAEVLAGRRRQIGETDPVTARRKVTLDQREVDSLVLPAGCRAHFDVQVPASGPRLDLQLGVLAAVPSAVHLEVQIRGEPLADFEFAWHDHERPDVFHPVQVDLSEFAGEEVLLSFATHGDPSAVGLWGTPRVLASPAAAPQRVLLISVDTLRADALHCYGGPDLTPTLDALAGEGTRFQDFYSTTSYTLPAHGSLLTGQYPLENGLWHRRQELSPDQSFTLASHLRGRGFLTAAFTGGGFVHPSFGFGLGFDLYDVNDPGGVVGLFGGGMPEKESFVPTREAQSAALRPALDWISCHSDQPFLVFLHTYFTHNYLVEPEFLELVECACAPADRQAPGSALWERAKAGDAAAARHLHHIYLAAVAQLDRRFLRPLRDTLEANGILDQTLIALVSDHGEQFLEHGGLGHGQWVWNELVRVPWLVRGPGVPAGQIQEGMAQLVDVAPTLLSLLDLDADPRIRGQALLGPRARPEPRDALFQYLEMDRVEDQQSWEGLRSGSWKILRRLDPGGAGEVLLFDALGDPDESTDLHAANQARTNGLLSRLDRWLAEMQEYGHRRPVEEGTPDEDVAARLQELGYAR